MVSHLLFPDDSLIFCPAALGDCRHLKRIFESYTTASGQCFNYEKSSLLFTPSVTAEVFGFSVVSAYDKYLGLSPMGAR